MTAILNLRVLTAEVTISPNEDWRDTFPFMVAAPAGSSYAVPGNIGTGTIGAIVVDPGAPTGNGIVRISAITGSITAFDLLDTAGNILSSGFVGLPFLSGGLSFTVTQGATAFAVGDSFFVAAFPKPADLTGLTFALAVRPSQSSEDVALKGSTGDMQLVSGGADGTLATNFAQAAIEQKLRANVPYVFDVLAYGDGTFKRVVVGTLSVDPGYAAPADAMAS